VGDGFLGRAVDAFGEPIDGGPAISADSYAPVGGAPIAPLDRATPHRVLETGIRAIDGLLTIGVGQRVGLFAAAGVGKTSLLSQLARQTPADRCILCLVGERGREIEAAWSSFGSDERMKKATLIAAASDQTAALRVRTADFALALGEHWRSKGLNVLLLLDSATRLAMAMREVGLAAGEPPTVRAYTPGVFALLPRIVERCGALKSGGSITAFFTVLTETDDVDDPIAELMKSILDGHIVLSRVIAEQGLFPAIDTPRSVSRSAAALLDDADRRVATRALSMISTYESSRTLIEAGVYAKGANADIDLAIERRAALLDFLRQGANERLSLAETRRALADAVGPARFAP
jgi:flagellum-specific ATP synthase